MRLRKNKSTPENRAFWARAAESAAEVERWPAWKRGVMTTTDDLISSVEARGCALIQRIDALEPGRTIDDQDLLYDVWVFFTAWDGHPRFIGPVLSALIKRHGLGREELNDMAEVLKW